MYKKETIQFSRTTTLLGSLLLAITFNLAFVLALASVPTEAQRYAQAHTGTMPALAHSPVAGRHHTWYA